MRKRKVFFFLALLVLMVSFVFSAHALAATNNTGADDGSDCGCSESGSSSSTSESSGWSAGYGTQTGVTNDNGGRNNQAIQNGNNQNANLIWVNLISIAVVAAIVIMLIRYRKSTKPEREADKTKNAEPGFVVSHDGVNERKPEASDNTVLQQTKRVFLQIQEAQRTGDINIVEPYVGQELYQMLERQQSAGGAGGRTESKTRVEIRDLRIVRRASENGTDKRIVRIQSRSADITEQSGKEEDKPVINGYGYMNTFYYTMERAEGETMWKLAQIRSESI